MRAARLFLFWVYKEQLYRRNTPTTVNNNMQSANTNGVNMRQIESYLSKTMKQSFGNYIGLPART